MYAIRSYYAKPPLRAGEGVFFYLPASTGVPSGRSMLVLEVTQGIATGRTFELGDEIIRIGRAPSNDVVLEDQHVSGEHARIVVGSYNFV